LNKFVALLFSLIIVAIGAILGWNLGQYINTLEIFSLNPVVIEVLGTLILGGLGYLASYYFNYGITRLANSLRQSTHHLTLADIFFGFVGVVLGLLITYLIALITHLSAVPIVGPLLSALLALFLCYLGIVLFVERREEISSYFRPGGRVREKSKPRRMEREAEKVERRYLLDTNVIIDGRIAEVLKSGIIEGTVIIPSLVLSELQYVADSQDPIRRARGRRGLDTLQQIQKESPVKIEILEVKPGNEPVDQTLLKLAKDLQATIITNDFNLAHVSKLQLINVINLNELAIALKPFVLPVEEIEITITKEGKELNQGVGYLDDGTMVVVEGGKRHIGETLKMVVTSILQTPAGRMVFARPVDEKNG